MAAGRALSRAILHMARDAAPQRSKPAAIATVVLMQLRKVDKGTFPVLLIRICVNGLIKPMGEPRTASISPMQRMATTMNGKVINAVLPACKTTGNRERIVKKRAAHEYYCGGGNEIGGWASLTGSWNEDICSGNFLAEVDCRVYRKIGVKSGKESYGPRYKITVPTGAVLEVGEDVFGVMLLLRETSQYTDDDKIPDNVEHKDY